MQAPTHILTGIILQRVFRVKHFERLSIGITAVVCYLFHGLLDMLSKVTYNPPQADITDPFWLFFHLAAILLACVMIYVYGSEYPYAITFSLLPDVDWLFVYAQYIFQFSLPVYEKPILHFTLEMFLEKIPGVNFLAQLPDYRNIYAACLFEILLLMALWITLKIIQGKRKNIHF